MKPEAWIRSIACLLLLAPLPGATAADTPRCGVLLTSETRDEPLPAPVVGSFVHLEVTGIVARGRVTQIFTNPTDEWMSGVYLFPLPENAAVDALTMRVGERVLEARVSEREAARAAYDQARESGVKAALLAQQRPDVFTASVAQVGPGEEIEIEIELQFEVYYDDGRFRLRFPLLVADRYRPAPARDAAPDPADPALPSPPTLPAGEEAANPVALRVDLEGGYPLSVVDSPTHAVRVARRPRFAYSVVLADELAPADGDFVLEWAAADDAEPKVSVAVEERGDAHYALLMVIPPARAPDLRAPRETIFVIDTSGSMQGTALKQAKRALRLALDDLEPTDRFNVIRFSDEPERLFATAEQADTGVLEEARTWVSALEAGGGTMSVPALAAALEGGQASSDRVRQVVFVTDGRVENEREFFARLRQDPGASRLFTVGIGSAPGGHFMRRAAELGRGAYTFISDPREVERQMTSLLAKLTSPVLTDVEVLWDDPTAEAWPRRVGDLYLGEPLVVSARLFDPDGDVHLSGRLNGETLTLSVPLAGAAAGEGIGKLWARRQIAELLEPPPADGAGPGIEPSEVRRQVVELALAHRLVTRYTSLIAVDDVATGAPGEAPDRLVPLLPPRHQVVTSSASVVSGSGGLAEELIVTSELPLVDVTVTQAGAVMREDLALEMMPVSRTLWSRVTRVPGVVADRQPAAGEVEPPRVRLAGAASDQNTIYLDGFDVVDELSGEPALELDGSSLREVEVATGGDVAQVSAPGVRIDLTTRMSGNDWQGVGSARGAGAAGSQSRRSSAAELTGGGRLVHDRLWLWSAVSERDEEREVIGGQLVGADLGHQAGKLRLAGTRYGLTAAWYRATVDEDGRGAGPDRLPPATWNHDERSQLTQLTAHLVATPDVIFSGGYGELDRRLQDLPVGGLGADAVTDSSGVTGGATFARAGERELEDGRVNGMLFFGGYPASHEVKLGVRSRGQVAADRWLTGGSRWLEAGTNAIARLAGAGDLLTRWHDATVETDLDLRSGWLQDMIQAGRLTLVLGLRWDEQRGTSRLAAGAETAGDAAVADADWNTVSPRVGLTLELDSTRRTVLRAAYGRFVSRLGPALTSRLAGGRLEAGPPVADVDLVADGDRLVDPAGAASRVPWLAVRPDLLAPDLSPELTDQALLGVEHQFGWRFVTGLTLTHRRSHDLLERRTLVRDADGVVRPATAGDWRPYGTLEGTVPGAEPYTVPVYDLAPGLERVPSGLWVNGDRRREALAASFTWRGRVGDRWHTRGHLSWSDDRMRLGPEFLRFDDPTDVLGSGDDDGDRAVELGSRGVIAGDAIDSGWTFHGSAGVELPWELNLAAAVDAREGHPLPYYRRVARDRAGLVAVELTDAASAVRAPDLVTLDARLAKELTFGDLSLSLAVEAFNLLGSDAVLRRELDLGVGRGGAVDEVVGPRVWRLGVRLGWK